MGQQERAGTSIGAGKSHVANLDEGKDRSALEAIQCGPDNSG
jgi:hypothetical protein